MTDARIPEVDVMPRLSADRISMGSRRDSSRDEKSSDMTPDEKEKPKYATHELAEEQEPESNLIYTPEDLAAGRAFPEESLPYEAGNQLTVRSLVVGTLLGLIVAASNVYLGLKTGFTFGSGLFASIAGCMIVKAMERSKIPEILGGGPFGPKENVCLQSAATASAGLSSMYVAAIPAMYRLGILTTPTGDFAKLITFCFATAFGGLFIAVPLRQFYLFRCRLVFPSPTATALTIQALHQSGARAMSIAKKKQKSLVYSFFGSLAFCIGKAFCPGILSDLHIFYWFWQWGWKSAIAVDNWGWYPEITPAFLGAGVLAGMNASLSFFLGTFLSWGVIGPLLVKTGKAQGKVLLEMDVMDASYYTSMNFKPATQPLDSASPRYWLLWPGVLIMFAYSVTEVAMNGKVIGHGIKIFAQTFWAKIRGRPAPSDEDIQKDEIAGSGDVMSPVWWVLGVVAATVFTIVVCAVQYNMNGGVAFLAIILSFIFAFIGCQASGTLDINPLSAVAKASQLIVGGISKAQGLDRNSALTENLLAGSIASSAAAHSVDMVGDFKTGHLVRAQPKAQVWAMVFGSIFAAPFSTGLFVLFAKAYPCILDEGIEQCPFSVPSVAAWKAVAEAVISDKLPVSLSSGLTAIFLALAASATVIAKHLWIPKKYHKYIFNWNGLGLAMIVPQTYYSIAMAVGAVIASYWVKKAPRNFNIYAYSISAGLIAGEGISGVVVAALTIGGADPNEVGTQIGIPPWLR